ncbi:MAG: serine/threonine-protein kinase [Polyangiaceae bacterium]
MSTLVREGETIAGKYRIDRVIGVGGMGMVMAAHHLELDDRVAIKFLLPETVASPEAVERFAREARAAVKIKNEHVARIADVGKLDDGTPYMVMEYLEGSDLAAWLIQQGPLPVEQAVEFVLQAGEAIAEAHSLGIVHRDLKPSNLFVTQRPDRGLSIKVLDFGISKTISLGRSGASMTRTAVMVGSPMYMSPQQIRSARDVDAQGDIWALGVILYELLAGVPPFDGENLAELVNRIISEAPPSIRSYRPEVPEALEQVILRCLARELDVRFATIAELAQALLPFAPRRAVASIERISGVRPATNTVNLLAPQGAPPTAESAERDAQRASWRQTNRSRTRTGLFLGAAFFVVTALALLVALSGAHEPPPAAAQAPAVQSPKAAPVEPVPPPAPAPAASLVVTLGAALPGSATAAPASAPPSVRPHSITAPPPAARAEPRRADPFDSNSWGSFRR